MSRTKKLLSLMLAVMLAVIVTVMPTAQVVAKAQGDDTGVQTADAGAVVANVTPGKYISEVRVGLGKSKSAAAASLAGYTILTDDKGEYADLNEGAESKSIIGSKGAKVVLLGYKTTDDPEDAITDLAVMNMDGGYSVKDYEILMEKYLNTQIMPLVNGLTAAIQEYRVNYSSANESNRKRAAYIHDALNKFMDDDTGKELGDLLLAPTKYEIGDEAYKALSEAQKQNTADIVTILMQANGQATLMLENLLARASDTADDTWLDRFAGISYDDFLYELCNEFDVLPSDAEMIGDRIYGDDAKKLFSMWNDFYRELSRYDEAVDFLDTFDADAAEAEIQELNAFIDGFDEDEDSYKDLLQAIDDRLQITAEIMEAMEYGRIIAICDKLEQMPYEDEFTMLDFFLRDNSEVDITELYPMVASLSAGQRAGLDFISLVELTTIALTDGAEYKDSSLEELETQSIYEGVDRGIYEKGAVALTSDAIRAGASGNVGDSDSLLSGLTIASYVLTGASFIGLCGSAAAWSHYANWYDRLNTTVNVNNSFEPVAGGIGQVAENQIKAADDIFAQAELESTHIFDGVENTLSQVGDGLDPVRANSEFCKKLTIGFTVAAVVLTAVSVYLTYRDLCNYYDTDFSPIPTYIVDEADITRKNEKGEVYVIKNQTAYYKAALCNRTKSDEKYKEIGDKADLNGDVGRMWVALYSVKNAAQYPILADSFKVVYGSSDVPMGYDKAIHKFGSGAAFDLNNTYYAWNHGKGGIYVYYKVDDTVPPRPNAVGTVQTAGTIAAVGGGGLIVGFLAGSLIMNRQGKKKDEEETAA